MRCQEVPIMSYVWAVEWTVQRCISLCPLQTLSPAWPVLPGRQRRLLSTSPQAPECHTSFRYHKIRVENSLKQNLSKRKLQKQPRFWCLKSRWCWQESYKSVSPRAKLQLFLEEVRILPVESRTLQFCKLKLITCSGWLNDLTGVISFFLFCRHLRHQPLFVYVQSSFSFMYILYLL